MSWWQNKYRSHDPKQAISLAQIECLTMNMTELVIEVDVPVRFRALFAAPATLSGIVFVHISVMMFFVSVPMLLCIVFASLMLIYQLIDFDLIYLDEQNTGRSVSGNATKWIAWHHAFWEMKNPRRSIEMFLFDWDSLASIHWVIMRPFIVNSWCEFGN